MKTAKYFDEYNEYVTGQRENINKLEKERQELTQRIKEDKVKYKELIANSQMMRLTNFIPHLIVMRRN